MRTVNIHEAKTHLSRLVEDTAEGEEIVIAKAGKPMARLVRVGPVRKRRKLGWLKGKLKVPEDFDASRSFRSAAHRAGHPRAGAPFLTVDRLLAKYSDLVEVGS